LVVGVLNQILRAYLLAIRDLCEPTRIGSDRFDQPPRVDTGELTEGVENVDDEGKLRENLPDELDLEYGRDAAGNHEDGCTHECDLQWVIVGGKHIEGRSNHLELVVEVKGVERVL